MKIINNKIDNIACYINSKEMASTTLAFQDQIHDVFGDLINEGRIVCSEKEFRDKFAKLQQIIKGEKPKSNRKTSNFMVWLNSNRRSEIKDEYFGDFESHEDWSADGIIEYYNKKQLPLEKLQKLIEKKQDEGKEIKKPRLMSLITIKAGLIWSEMTDEEKLQFCKDETSEDNSPKEKSSPKKPSKKGRPAGYKPHNYASDQSVLSSIKNAKEASDDEEGEDVELEVFNYKGRELFKDDSNNIYNEECELIGKINDDGFVNFNQ